MTDTIHIGDPALPVRQTKAWLTKQEACKHLGVGDDLLLERMRQSDAAGLNPAWINAAVGKRNNHRFDTANLDQWWREIHAWLARQSAGTKPESAGQSAGATPTGSNATSTARARKTRKRSLPTSTRPSSSDAAGRLLQLGKALTSRQA